MVCMDNGLYGKYFVRVMVCRVMVCMDKGLYGKWFECVMVCMGTGLYG